MAEDGKLKIDSMMVMISASVRCRWKTLYIRRIFRSLWQKPNLQNTVEDRIMDSGALFHVTYCKEELERFELRSGKVRLADDKTLDIVGVEDVVLKTSFGTNWSLKDVSLEVARGNKRGSLYMVEVHPEGIGAIINGSGSAAVWFGEAEESFLHNVSEDKETAEQELRAESTGIHVEALKMLWADSVSTAYLIYRIPYVPIGLCILEEEWREKDTSLTHLKVFGCESFVKVKDVCGEAMKCTFIGSGSDEMRYNFRDTKSHQVIRSRAITLVDSIYGARSEIDSSSLTKLIQKSQVVLVDIPENLAENDNIVVEHGLSSEITQSPGGSSDTSEGSEISGSFEDSRRSDEEYSEDGASSIEGGSETPQVRRSTRDSKTPWKKAINEEMVSLEKNQTCSLVRISTGKKASQRLLMFKVKEEQNDRKRYKARLEPSYVGALNDTSTQHKSEGPDMAEFNKLKWQLPLVFEMKDRCSEKQVLGYVLTVGVTRVEWESRLHKSITIYTKSSIHLVKNLKVCSWAKLVRILVSEGSLSLLKILGTKSLAAMFTRLVMKSHDVTAADVARSQS
ncbi:retrovirus-related pol polyprotein from transposon TNT 1-94 [Tanacetum coccineum]